MIHILRMCAFSFVALSLFTGLSFAEADKSPLERLLAAGFAVIDNPYKRKITKQELHALLKEDVVGILAGLEPLDRDMLSGSCLKCISRVGAGMSNVDLQAAKEMGLAKSKLFASFNRFRKRS